MTAATAKPDYITAEQLKGSREMSGTDYADEDVRLAIASASRAVDDLTGARFWADDDADQVRYFTPHLLDQVRLFPLTELTAVEVDPSGYGSYDDLLVRDSDFVLEPRNAVADGEPWTALRLLRGGARRRFPDRHPRDCVRVTGRFGWPEPPERVRTATTIIAAKFLLRMRQAPHGVVDIGPDGMAVRIGRYDPDVERLLKRFTKRKPLFR